MQILSNPLYVCTVLTGAIVSGVICFILYFITQVLTELDFADTEWNYIMVAVVFVLAPIPGNIAGAWFVQNRLGGYRNHRRGMLFTMGCMVAAALSCGLLTACALMQNAWGSERAGGWVMFGYGLSFVLFLFFGAAPTATINGTAVSLLPGVSIAGSGVQFSLQNMGRLVIPAVGGVVIDNLGKVVLGFQLVILSSCVVALLLAFAAYRVTLGHRYAEIATEDSDVAPHDATTAAADAGRKQAPPLPMPPPLGFTTKPPPVAGPEAGGAGMYGEGGEYGDESGDEFEDQITL